MTKLKSQSPDHDIAVFAGLPSAETLLVGQVLESCIPIDPAHALIRWRTSDGQLYERTLTVVKGLSLAAGDLVLLQRPANWPEWMITQVVESTNELNLPGVSEL